MNLQFFKYQGTGNDFILIDNRENNLNNLNKEIIEKFCSRKFGIGADGLILLQNENGYDFKMVYFNSDGKESTMCGNGGRCIAKFAKDLGLVSDNAYFLAIDGPHYAHISSDSVKLKMKDVKDIKGIDDFFILDTGSPHYVRYAENLDEVDVYIEGKKIRNSEPFKSQGINVNFINKTAEKTIHVRTYERGVENETFSCGTGVVASALVNILNDYTIDGNYEIKVLTKGGNLSVIATRTGNTFNDIWLVGPVEFVYKGETNV
jgi:diaminopimelate epimerase